MGGETVRAIRGTVTNFTNDVAVRQVRFPTLDRVGDLDLDTIDAVTSYGDERRGIERPAERRGVVQGVAIFGERRAAEVRLRAERGVIRHGHGEKRADLLLPVQRARYGGRLPCRNGGPSRHRSDLNWRWLDGRSAAVREHDIDPECLAWRRRRHGRGLRKSTTAPGRDRRRSR